MGAAKQYQLPPGAWDSHVHVVDEVSKFARVGMFREYIQSY